MNRKTKLCALLLALTTLLPMLFACAPEIPQTGTLNLSEDGQSKYRIVISEQATKDTVTIAEEFVGYFEKITGATLEIVRDNTPEEPYEIVIGRTNRPIDGRINYSKMDEEGLVYYTEKASLLLTGGSDRGVAYAVYGFLEDYCGVRYWSPDYETVPEEPSLQIPSEIVFHDEPVFWYRDMNESGSSDPKWMVKMRLNSRQSLGSERFCKTPFVGGGHGYADWFVHTLAKLAEMENDYPDRTSFTNLQPCLSSEETYQTVLKNVRKWLDEYPDATIISISQNDGTNVNAVCTCPDCRKLYAEYGQTQSAKFVWFVAKIANELADEYPDVYFDTLAYNFTLSAPSNLEIPDNMIIRLAPAHACINHDYKECGNGNGDGSPPQKATEEFYLASMDWAKIAEHRFVWDYDALFYNYLAPFCNFDYIHKNIQNYAEDGYEGVFLQGDSSGSNGFSELRAYLVAKCLWDPFMSDEEFDAMMNDFLKGYYGEGAAEPLTEYIDLINHNLENDHFSLYATMCIYDLLSFGTLTDDEGTIHLDESTIIGPSNELFDQAEAAVTDKTQLHHLRKARTQIKYYEVMALYWISYEGDSVVIDYERRKELNTSLYDDVIDCGISYISEGQVVTSTPNLNYAPPYWDR